jgi:para-nitrobenzyl esterase
MFFTESRATYWIVLTVALATPGYSTPATPVVDVPNLGRVRGIDRGSGVSGFYGIPFAQPPTGELRWKPPQAHKGWGTKALNATAYGACCLQGSLGDTLHSSRQLGSSLGVDWGEIQSEDCLFLNIAAPSATLGNAASKIPVMVWIHGGGYQEGDPSEYPIESLAAAAKGSVIVVSVSYRLGLFGFLGGGEIAASTGGGGSGNFGIQDQRAGIKWCKENIAAFGGNGDDITIFGESAGATSPRTHRHAHALKRSGIH